MVSQPDRQLILVRHAQTIPVPEVESAAWELADTARDECRRLALKLAPLRPDRIITSDHHKCVTTGSFLAEDLDLPCETVTGLEEHDRSGVPFIDDPQEWLTTLGRLFERPDEVVLGSETANEALERFGAAVRREVERRPDELLIMATHATVMALFVARTNRLDPWEFWQTIEMPEAIVLRLPDYRLVERLSVAGASNREFNRA